MEHVNMKLPIQLANHLKVFDRMIQPMINSRDRMRSVSNGEFANESDQKKFDELDNKVEIIKELQRLILGVISIIGITGEFGEDFLKTMIEGDKDIERLIKKAKKVYGYAIPKQEDEKSWE